MYLSRYASRLAGPQPVPVSTASAPPQRKLPHPASVSAQLESTRAMAGSMLSPSLQIPRDLPQEPEDARITGGTRSLSRRLLALNIPTARADAERLVRRTINPATRSASAQKSKTAKRPTLSSQWVGQDA